MTPEYPNGTYAYFATVDDNWNSAYPYVVGPTFYGNVVVTKVTTVTEPTTTYSPAPVAIDATDLEMMNINIFPNPASDLIAVQVGGLVKDDIQVTLMDITGRVVAETKINAGQTIAYFDVQTLYAGTYAIRISSNQASITRKVVVAK